jgi:hypothetical protein
LMAVEKHIPIREVKIKTIYLDGNSSSHFNPILDSIRIYRILGRFAFARMMPTKRQVAE